MSSSDNATDTGLTSWTSSGIITTDFSQSGFTSASSLSLSLTAASTSDEPPLTSVTWGSISSAAPSSSIDSGISSTDSFITSSNVGSTTEPFTTTTYDPTTSSWVTTSDSDFTTTSLSETDSETSSATGSVSSDETTSNSHMTSSTTSQSDSSSGTTSAPSSDTDTSGSTWSQFTTTGEITSDGRVVTVEYTSSALVAITQATTVMPSSSASPTADADNKSSSGGTKTSTKIAVGVVVPVGALSILALGFYYMRHHKHTALRSERTPSEPDFEDSPGRHSKHNSINAHHMF